MKYNNVSPFIIYLKAFICSIMFVLVFSSSAKEVPTEKQRTKMFGRLLQKGDYDSVVSLCNKALCESLKDNDTLLVQYYALNLAQVYLVKDMPDSINFYLDILSDYRLNLDDGDMAVFGNHVYGIYSLRYELDYEKALVYHLKAYACAEHMKDWNNAVSQLGNVVNIYYSQHDGTGLEYAKRAVEMSEKYDCVSPYNRISLKILLASMLLLNNYPDDAMSILDSIKDKVSEYDMSFIVNMLKGDILQALGNFDEAEESYILAIASLDNSSTEAKSSVFLKYGDLLKSKKHYGEAIDMYKNGLSYCVKTRDLIYLKDLLGRIYETYAETENKDSMSVYQMRYYRCLDSLNIMSSERRFYQRARDFQELEHELDIMIFRKKLLTAVFISVIVALLGIFSLILYIHQRHMYRALVIQHQRYLHQLKNNSDTNKEDNDQGDGLNDSDRKLFMKIEYMMKTEKLYRKKNLTLDKIAEEVGTNRSYVSRAINVCSNMKFCNYIDSYRVTEATSIISEQGERVSFKQLAEDLGYNSVSVFYRSFQREVGCPPGRYRDEVIRMNRSNSCR